MIISAVLVFIPIVLIGSVCLKLKQYGIISTIVVILSMLPFFMLFESRRPRAREIMPIAVMSAIAAVSRFAFAFLPQFKPIVAVVIITAVAFGAEAGFLCGAVSMLVSNFFFGQGPWTPWQMFCCGVIGFLAGLLSKMGWLKSKWSLCAFGIFSGYLYGAIVDIWSVIGFAQEITWQTVFAIYISGFWFNTILAVATAFFLYVLAKPMIEKLERIKTKYGLKTE